MASSNEELNSSGNSFSSLIGAGSENAAIASDGPSDSRCPICLEKIRNVAFLNPCFHTFCFACILEWSDRKAECPLCKQNFHSFFHTIRSDTDFEEYIVPLENASFDICGERSATAETPEALTDHGILHEGFSGPQAQGRMRTLDELMRQLGIRRPPYPEGISLGQIREHVTIKFRRALYRSGVRVRNVQSGGFYRDISADFFHRNPVRLTRLVPWLKRELRVLYGAHPSLINDIQDMILYNITIYDLDSQAFAEIIQPHLFHFTSHFLHEFINFARSPFNIKAYDWRASYDVPFPAHDDGSQSYSSFTTSSSEQEEEEGEIEDSEENEGEEGESVTSNEERTWDDNPQRSASSGSDQTLDEFFLPFGSSDRELARSNDNKHGFFQPDAQLSAPNRHGPLCKCILDQTDENTPIRCKCIPTYIEATQHEVCGDDDDDDDNDEGLVNEQETLRNHGFGSDNHGSTGPTISNAAHLVTSNPKHNSLQAPLQEQETDSLEHLPLHQQDIFNTKPIHHKGKEIVVIEVLQPRTEDILVIEHLEWNMRDMDDFAQLPWHGEDMSNCAEQDSSTDITPGGSATNWDDGCFSYIRRP